MSTSTENHAAQPKPVQAASTRLYGRPEMNEAERAAFLAKAREAEASYGPKDYQHQHDVENRFYDPKHRMNTLPPLVNSDQEKKRILSEMINFQLDTGNMVNGRTIDGQYSLQDNLRSYAAAHTQAAAAPTVATQHSEQAPAKSSAWYNQAGKAANGNPIPDAYIANVSSSVTIKVVTPAPFKPYVAPDLTGAEALYTSNTQPASSKSSAWYNQAGKASNKNPVPEAYVDKVVPKHVGKITAAIGLFAAAESAVANTNGTVAEKLMAAGTVLKGQAVDQIPGVTYVKTMAEAIKTGSSKKFQEARLDAAGYLPLGDAAGIARSPEAQAVIDALPKNRAELEKMQSDKTQAPINRHLAEYQLAFIEAKDKGDVFKGLDISNRLSELAEKKVVLQAQWKENAKTFDSAIKSPNANFADIAKNNPDIAPQIAIHIAAVNHGHLAAFVKQMDYTLSQNIASGTPVSPQMLQVANAMKASAQHDQQIIK